MPRYLKILSHGGSQSPETIITEAGFDMASPDFWQGGFEVLREMLEELEGGGEKRGGKGEERVERRGERMESGGLRVENREWR